MKKIIKWNSAKTELVYEMKAVSIVWLCVCEACLEVMKEILYSFCLQILVDLILWKWHQLWGWIQKEDRKKINFSLFRQRAALCHQHLSSPLPLLCKWAVNDSMLVQSQTEHRQSCLLLDIYIIILIVKLISVHFQFPVSFTAKKIMTTRLISLHKWNHLEMQKLTFI